MKRLRISLRAWSVLAKKIDPQRSRQRWHWQQSLSAACQSLLMRMQEASYAEALICVSPPPPIFLLGFWRSGTTLLHELFCCDRKFGYPSTYACLNSAHFLLTERSLRHHVLGQSSRRPMDNVQYSWASPQEDEFALLSAGAPSPYEALLLPSLLAQPRSLLDLNARPAPEQELWKECFLNFLRMLTLQQGKPMVLKSPSHGFKLSRLAVMFPESRFVIIERNPFEVFASNVKLWQTLLDLYSLESYSSDDVEEFVLAAYVIHEEAIADGCRTISHNRLARVRYEDLVTDSIAEMRRLYSELQLEDFEAVRPAIEEYLRGVSGYKRNRYHLSDAQKERIEQRWSFLIRHKGYDLSTEPPSLRQSALHGLSRTSA